MRMVCAVVACGVAVLSLFATASALAAGEGAPQWTVSSVSRPTNFKPGDQSGEDAYVVSVTNTGGAASNGEPVTISDELPSGLSLDPAGAAGHDELLSLEKKPGAALTCVLSSCTFTGAVVPDDSLLLVIPVDVAANANPLETNVVRVSGGGALDASMQTPTSISEDPAAFGISPGGATTALSTRQAGAHPDLTTSIAFNTVNREEGELGKLAGDPKDTTDNLPPGFAGDLIDTPTCPGAAFLQEECPIGTQVGVTTVTLAGETSGAHVEPVYNLAPSPGEVAKLGFAVEGKFFYEGDVAVRPGDYGLKTTFYNATAGIVELDNVSLTVWGVPADPIHNALRWNGLPKEGLGAFGATSEERPVPFFTNPTACEATPLEASFSVTSWQHPQESESPAATSMPFGSLAGCDRLAMKPALSVETTTSDSYAPTGLDLEMKIPQTYENSAGLATSTLKQAVVTLPEGMTVNPSAGAGLAACTPSQYAEESVQFVAEKGCPSNSKLGTVRITTPSLKEEATGSVFLAQPYANPFKSLLALYIVARIPNRGVLVRAAGEVTANPVTGQLVTTFDTADVEDPHGGLPPLPFSTFIFSFRQGATSPLVTPPLCGEYTVQARLTPWSDPEGAPLTPLIPPFPIDKGFDGGACPSGGVAPFAPQVAAGTEDANAGASSSLDIRIGRGDGEQEITRFSSQLPPGLTANLSGVPFCPEASIEAAKSVSGAQEEVAPSCPAASQIGTTLVGAGVGSVLAQAPGKVYMAGPYNGAPFSVVAITSAKVGPFDLGTVVVREALAINPETAVVTVDAKASDPIPHIIDGIVIHVREIRVDIDRPNFTSNPTNCNPFTFLATVDGSGADFASSADDVPVTVGVPFRVTACQALKFKPSFKVSTSGKTSRKNGASLTVKLAYPKAAQGTQANIHSVKVDLPKQLPSQLKTLQKACLAATFAANPAACPQASRVGHATAITPILPVALTGPAYFVSYGSAKFPELVLVLQGYGVTIDLHGETFIDEKTGITSSTFRAVPDQPVTSFELVLPQGKYPALAANGNLCAGKLTMPTAFTAQNGIVTRQNTKVSVTGCPRGAKQRKRKPVKKVGKHVHRRKA